MSYAVDGNGPTQNSGFQSTSEGGGSVELIIPLSHFGLGLMEDIKCPIYNAKFEIIFTRNTNDDALILETNTEATEDTKNIKSKHGALATMRRHIDFPIGKLGLSEGLMVWQCPRGRFRMTILVGGDFCIKVNGWTGSCLI
ncbi:hypothetical protein QTP88_021241 [Uroleucon formosanum]